MTGFHARWPRTWARVVAFTLPCGFLAIGGCLRFQGGDPFEPPAVDLDGDGVSQAGGDCDDSDALRFPGAPETCDGADQDCDDEIDEGIDLRLYWFDGDGDGFGADGTEVERCGPYEDSAPAGGDCDDTNDRMFPGAIESCDGLDENCSGSADEGLLRDLYVDEDGDGWGGPTAAGHGCPGLGLAGKSGDCADWDPRATPEDSDGDGFSGCEEDCDDADAAMHPYVDIDGDGHSPCTVFGWPDCDDLDPTIFPGLDLDGDGAPGCPNGLVPDCDDEDPAIHPFAPDVCDDVDDDCDGAVDDDAIPTLWIHGPGGVANDLYYQQLEAEGYCVETLAAAAVVDDTPLHAYRLVVVDGGAANETGFRGSLVPFVGLSDNCWTSVIGVGPAGALALAATGSSFWALEAPQQTVAWAPAVPEAWAWEAGLWTWSYPHLVLDPSSAGPAAMGIPAEASPFHSMSAATAGAAAFAFSDASRTRATILQEWACAPMFWWGYGTDVTWLPGSPLFRNLVVATVGVPAAR